MYDTEELVSRVRAAVLLQAFGDALGAPFEFAETGAVERDTGKDWLDALHSFKGEVGAHNAWMSPAPLGTGTDDVRYSWLFMELVNELGRMPTGREIARRLLAVHERPGAFFPGYEALAVEQFAMWEGVSRGFLGEESKLYPGVSPAVLATRSVGLNYPTIAGMLVLPFAGLLFPGDPTGAYCAVYEAAFFDVAYAREATALWAAAQSLALVGADPSALVERVLSLDPLQLGGPFGRPFVVQHLPSLLQKMQGKKARELAAALSFELRHYSVFDPFRTLAIAFAVLLSHADEPLVALQVAANQGDLSTDGRWLRYADTDCYAGIAGTLLGAVNGAGVISSENAERVVASNRQVYGIDLEASALAFAELVRARGSA